MRNFWESSPEWQRREELKAVLDVASDARDKAGRQVLMCVELGFLDGPIWRADREVYLTAAEGWQEAFQAWVAASEIFEASATGQALARYLRSPLLSEATESEAA